jgi:hypothetical protein
MLRASLANAGGKKEFQAQCRASTDHLLVVEVPTQRVEIVLDGLLKRTSDQGKLLKDDAISRQLRLIGTPYLLKAAFHPPAR